MKCIFILFVIVNLFCSLNFALAEDRSERPESNWAKEAKVDFCANANTFDFRNAYWLGALSYYSYWHIKYADPLISSSPELDLKLDFEKATHQYPESSEELHGLGFGKLRAVFFSSTPALPEAAVEKANLVRTWQPALPFEACVKPNRFFCFAAKATPVSADFTRKSQAEIDICGESNLKAYFEVARLRNIQKLVLGKPLSPKIAQQAARDKDYIENLVRTYEEKKNVKLNLNWFDEKTPERCEIFKNRDDHLPDTQAGLFENDEAITIAVRGTESGNMNDIRTDLMTFNQIDLSETSEGQGSIHRGFYKAAIVMKNWLIKELAKIRMSSPERAKKPIFITGHSLGGALANLITYTILEYNNSVKDQDLRFNLKALYTFGAPRVGDRVWASRIHELAEQMDVGLYRMVNFSDLVPNVPCLNYAHAGALVYMDASGLSKITTSLKVVLNPLDRIINLGNSHINIANCGYETVLHYPLRLKEMIGDHFMTSYYVNLSLLRNSLNEKLEQQKQQALIKNDFKAAAQLTYPLNCQKPSVSNLNLEGIELNYQLLKNNFED